MALTWFLDESSHDITITSNGKLQTVTSADEVKQRILVTLLHSWKEYFLNVQAGVPWYELILGSKDKKMVEAFLRRTVLDVPGVLAVVQFEVVFNNPTRTLAIYADVETVYGVVSLQTER